VRDRYRSAVGYLSIPDGRRRVGDAAANDSRQRRKRSDAVQFGNQAQKDLAP
jgi:hypothetical protein